MYLHFMCVCVCTFSLWLSPSCECESLLRMTSLLVVFVVLAALGQTRGLLGETSLFSASLNFLNELPS